jgi:PmbA protein
MDKFKKDFYEELSSEILKRIQKQGASSAEVTISMEAGFSVTSRLCQVETIQHNQNKGLGITVYFDHQAGSSSSTDLSLPAIEKSIQKACNIAKYTSPDPCAGLADKELMAFNYPELDLYHPWDITPEKALEFAIECESLAMQDPKITNSEGASLSSHRTLHTYANTQGFSGHYLASHHSLNCILIAENEGKKHRGYDFTMARDAQDLMKIEDLAKSASLKTVKRLGSRRLKTCRAPIIFSADMAKGLLGNFIGAINGSNIYRNSSFLVDKLGSQIFPSHINLTQYPHTKKAMGSLPFDSEGVRTIEQDFVKNGILNSYLLSSYSARKLGMKSTGNAGGVFNLMISNENISLPELISRMDKGLLVTELMGQGVNLVTGDYSRGAFGYWIENGEILYPVEEITIAGNLKDMFFNIIGVANDIDRRGRIQTGSILIENMTIAGE